MSFPNFQRLCQSSRTFPVRIRSMEKQIQGQAISMALRLLSFITLKNVKIDEIFTKFANLFSLNGNSRIFKKTSTKSIVIR